MLKETLKKSGFSEKEADVYLAMVESGPSIVSAIAKRAHLNRSTTYVVLDSLAGKGLVSVAERQGAKIFTPASPDRIVRNLESAAKQYSELAGEVKKIIPKLKSQKLKTATKPKIQLFEGSDGIKTVYEDALNSLETIRTYAFNSEGKKSAPNYAEGYYDRLTKKNIKVRMLFPETSEAHELKAGGKKSDLAGMPRDFSPEISVYGSKVVFMSPEENFGLIIESQELADAMKKAFDLSWQETKGLSKKSFNVGTAPA